jgi:histidyl-tRNA synthetase
MGKYGEEGDKLIFKILNNGLDNPQKKEQTLEGIEKLFAGKNSPAITERALRYDLTIPFARYVAMNHGSLSFPFKRYQIQPVWRADRPQKGRYREFYQCDADVVGSESLLNEVDLVAVYLTAFQKLNLPVALKINNRKILTALAILCGGDDRMIPITIAIDKLDKIGIEKVKEELNARGLTEAQVALVESFISITGNNEEKLNQLEAMFSNISIGVEGVNELRTILSTFENISQHSSTSRDKTALIVDLTLARGLNYYTGAIFEVKAIGVQMGSIGGGGRYDDLTGLFGVNGIAGVGISFGVDRIYDVMEELNVFPENIQKGTSLLFFNTGPEEQQHILRIAQSLRSKNISCEIYHEATKFDKQFKYAEKKSIPNIAIIGSKEIEAGTAVIKNLSSGIQKEVVQADIDKHI